MSAWADEINALSEKLLNQLIVVQQAELTYNDAKATYESLQRQIAESMRMNGIEDVGTDRGCRLVLVEKAHCAINKNVEDRENVARWMEEKGFDAKVKRTARVSSASIEDLKRAGIAFKEELDINTNSVKAVIKEMLAAGQMTLADIPRGCNYYQEDIVEVRS